jgi:hypothetical protein
MLYKEFKFFSAVGQNLSNIAMEVGRRKVGSYADFVENSAISNQNQLYSHRVYTIQFSVRRNRNAPRPPNSAVRHVVSQVSVYNTFLNLNNV